MNRKILSGPDFCAVKEDGKLVEYISLSDDDRCGDILLGRIGRIMSGMQCAFVDIGRKKEGFLPLSENSRSFTGEQVRSGDTILVQIKKEEHADKGAFLSRDITLPGRFIILMPMNRYTGVSSRIDHPDIREKLRDMGSRVSEGQFGIIMRLAAADAGEKEIHAETEELYNLWHQLYCTAEKGGRPGTVLMHGNPAEQLQKDYSSRGDTEIQYMDEPDGDLIRQLNEAGQRRLQLPGGGNIVIDRCEAMTVIDVNTASAQDAGSKEQLILQTNLEACLLISQQIRLRNLSGIIMIDFIDMETENDRNLVQTRLDQCFRNDRVKTVIHGWTKLGLMEMTRKRTRRENNE